MEFVEATVTIEDVDEYLQEILGVAEEHGVVVQGFDARYLVGRRHVRAAVSKAERAFRRGENVAGDPGMEALLYAAGTRQIDRATEIGLKEGDFPAVFVVSGSGDVEVAADRVRELVGDGEVTYGERDRLVDYFGVSQEELEAVGREKLGLLVLERVALLDVRK